MQKDNVMPVRVEDRQGLVDQYIKHNDTEEIFKIKYVGQEGVTAYRSEGFGGKTYGSEQFEITWASLRHKHTILVHVTDIETQGNA